MTPISTSTRIGLSAAAELFKGMSATVSGGMVVQGHVAVPDSWALLLLLGFVIGFGGAWGEVRAWMRGEVPS